MRAGPPPLRVTTAILIAVLLAACAHPELNPTSIIKDAQSHNVPIYIYMTSWNNVSGPGSVKEVKLVSLADSDIEFIKLNVSACERGGKHSAPSLILSGLFAKNRLYAAHPAWSSDMTPTLTEMPPDEYHGSSGDLHLIIDSLEIRYEDGHRQTYTTDIAEFLSPDILNKCGPGKTMSPQRFDSDVQIPAQQ